jgi:glutamine amidotransferase
MCRLLYIRSNQPFLIREELNKFAQISRNSKEYQGHGWGCAYLKDDEWKIYKDIKPIWEDNFNTLPSTTLLVAHARSAFKDQDIDVVNNMPFRSGQYIYIFNGELHGVRLKEKGKIGAEKIFNFILRFNKGDMQPAIQKSVEIIDRRSKYIRAMNFIIADKKTAYVYSDFNEDPDYFTLSYKNNPGQIRILSEIDPQEKDWHILPKKELKVF